jgi:hypothetical protein
MNETILKQRLFVDKLTSKSRGFLFHNMNFFSNILFHPTTVRPLNKKKILYTIYFQVTVSRYP